MCYFVRSALIVALCIMSWATPQAAGTIIIEQASLEFSGATAPQGEPPWLTVTFDDQGSSGSVLMTFEATNLVGSEFVSGLYLNVAAGIDPDALVFSMPAKTGSFQDPTVYRGADAFKADGAGHFDIMLDFATGGGAAKRFAAGEAVSYTITGLPLLTAASFDAVATPSNKPGSHYMAAHVQGIGLDGELSGWVTGTRSVPTPEPVSLSLLSLGCVMAMRRRAR